jgi:Sulfotransferase family
MPAQRPPASGRQPFPFIVGFGRSGTTLLRAMLDSHPDLAIPPETHFVVPMAMRRRHYERDGFDHSRFLADLFTRFGGRMRRWGLDRATVAEALARSAPTGTPEALRAVYGAYAARHRKPRYGDKTPVHVLNLPLLGALFPESRFVHIIRDGRDSTVSYLAQEWGPTTVAEGALRWRRAIHAGRREGARLGPTRYREVRYEALVNDPEAELRPLCSFLGLSFHPAVLRYHLNAERLISETDESHSRLRQPPTAGVRDWRRDMSASDIALFEALAGDALEDLGYERTSAGPGLPARWEAGWRRLAFHGGRALRRLRKAVPRANPPPARVEDQP